MHGNTADCALSKLVHIHFYIYYACRGRSVHGFTGHLLHHGCKHWNVYYQVQSIFGDILFKKYLSTLVAFANITTPTEFRNAVSCAVLPAGFNWCTVFILMPLEMGFGMMEKLTAICTKNINETQESTGDSVDPIAFITDPIQQYVLTINKDGLGKSNYTGSFVQYCKTEAATCSGYCYTGLNCTYTNG